MPSGSSAFQADHELIEALESRAQPVVCNEVSILFRQGENSTGLYILRKGKAILTMRSPEGEVVLSVETNAGSLLGLPGLLANGPYSLTAFACKGAELTFVSREDFNDLLGSQPQLSFKVLQILAAEVRSARQALLDY